MIVHSGRVPPTEHDRTPTDDSPQWLQKAATDRREP